MHIARRTFLKSVAGVGAGVLAHALADPAGLPHSLRPVYAAQARDFASHVMHRLTFGPRPGLLADIRAMGPDTWIEHQLALDTLDDSAVTEALQSLDTIWQTPLEIFAGDAPPENRGQFIQELQIATLLRAAYSERQLFELMVHFWSDHFNIFMPDGALVFLKPTDDREVIRPHALGTFDALLSASAHSPAMLIYLDNASNNLRAPNENYARELLELHTLGVNGGYTEDDVKAAARVLTGWSIVSPRDGGDERGTFMFRERAHDRGEHVVLGQAFDGATGEAEGERMLAMLAAHASTANFIATKLARRFVADDPPESVVNSAAATFQQTNGDVRAVLRTIFASDEFRTAPPKLKRPWPYVVSLLRAFDARIDWSRPRSYRALAGILQPLGHIPFFRPSPDGYPDTAEAWAGNLLARWNVALAVVFNQLPGIEIDLARLIRAADIPGEPEAIFSYFTDLLLGRELSEAERAELWAYVTAPGTPDLQTEDGWVRLTESIALLAASPAFQYR